MNLPHKPELEMFMIGKAMVDGKIPSMELSTDDFYSRNAQACWSAICLLDEDGEVIDPFSVHREAHKAGADEHLTIAELTRTFRELPPTRDISREVIELKELSRRRMLIRELYRQAEQLSTGVESHDVILQLEDRLVDLRTDNSVLSGFVPLSTIVDHEVKPALQLLLEGKHDRIMTGFAGLDHQLIGGSRGDCWLIAADTGVGKSIMVMQLAAQMATPEIDEITGTVIRPGYKVAYASGEMRDRENGLRLLSHAAGVSNLNSVLGLNEEHHHLLTQWAEYIKNLPIFYDSTTIDIQTLERNLRALQAKHGLDVLILDYAQLYRLHKNDWKMTRTERLTELSQAMKRLAGQLGILVIEVVQFNREGMKKTKAEIHDIEGAGQFEKDCSVMLIIDKIGETQITIRIVKGRNTGHGEVSGTFDGPRLRFHL